LNYLWQLLAHDERRFGKNWALNLGADVRFFVRGHAAISAKGVGEQLHTRKTHHKTGCGAKTPNVIFKPTKEFFRQKG